MKLGSGLGMSNFEEGLKFHQELGFECCQIGANYERDYASGLTKERAAEMAGMLSAAGITISSFWPSYPFIRETWRGYYQRQAPPTWGLVPPGPRPERLVCFKKGSDFAAWLGCPAIAHHIGYIPEDPSDPLYEGLLEDLGDLLDYCQRNDGQYLLFESGQESLPALMRLFEDLGRPNMGANYDTGNMLLYGRANPVDGLDMIGKYVRDVHAKDGEYPTAGYALGQEKPLGEGRVDFPAFINKLKAIGYDGCINIECELRGDKREAMLKAKAFLEPLIKG